MPVLVRPIIRLVSAVFGSSGEDACLLRTGAYQYGCSRSSRRPDDTNQAENIARFVEEEAPGHAPPVRLLPIEPCRSRLNEPLDAVQHALQAKL